MVFIYTKYLDNKMMQKSSATTPYQHIDLEAPSTIKTSSLIKNKEQSPKVMLNIF